MKNKFIIYILNMFYYILQTNRRMMFDQKAFDGNRAFCQLGTEKTIIYGRSSDYSDKGRYRNHTGRE